MKSSCIILGALGCLCIAFFGFPVSRAAPIETQIVVAGGTRSTLSITDLNPYPSKPRVTFRADGTFKITIFSDLHYGENPWDTWGPQQDVNSTRLMRTVLSSENPDYVVLNGDQITGENTFRENSTLLIDEIVAPLNEVMVPFSSTQGNHDNDVNITHLKEIEREQLVAPLSYTRTSPPGVGGIEGPGSYWVPVYEVALDIAPVLILWFFDSRSGKSPNDTQLPDWVDTTVTNWLQSELVAMEMAWGPATRRAALAFVHIPPYAIQAVQETLNSTSNPGLNADLLSSGSTQGTTEASNVGNDQSFYDAVTAIPNLHAIISGHDHGNEWCAREPSKHVIFCFDKHSGYGGYSSLGWNHGVRNIVFPSCDPKAGLDTWIRYEDGEVKARVMLDENYM